jgi:hypothetical protein
VFVTRDLYRNGMEKTEGYACRHRLYEEDVAWLESPSDEPFSLLWICTHPNLDPDAVRRAFYANKPLEHHRVVKPRTGIAA